MVKTQNPNVFGPALGRLVKLSADEYTRELIRKKEKHEMDIASWVAAAREEGEARGREKGIAGLIAQMRANGRRDDEIAAFIGLSAEVVASY